MGATIRYTDHTGQEAYCNLDDYGNVVIIGRNPDCSVYANSLSVSRNHAKVFLENGAFYILDLGSSNGLFVNGHRVDREELRDKDVIKCGDFPLFFAWTAPEQPYVDAEAVSAELQEARDALAEKEELVSKQAAVIKKYEDKLASQTEEVTLARDKVREIDPLKEIIKNLQEERDKLKDENRRQYEQVNTQQLELNKVEVQLRHEKERNDEVSRTAMISQENLRSTIQDRDELRRRVLHLEEQSSDLNEDVNQKLIEIDRLEKQIQIYEQQTDGGNRDVRLLSEKNAALKEVITEKEKLVAEMKDKVEDQRQEAESLRRDLDMQKSLAQEGAQAGDLVDRLRNQVREKDATVGEYTTLLQTAKQDVARLTEELKKRDDESVRRNLDDERNLFGIKEQLAERDKEIFGLRKQLDKAEDASRSKPAAAADSGLAAKVEELKESVQDYRARAEGAEKKLGTVEKKLKDAEEATRLAKQEAAEAAAAATAGGGGGSREQEREIQKLKTELKRAMRDTKGGTIPPGGAPAADDEETEKLREEITKLKKDLRAAEQSAAAGAGAAAATAGAGSAADHRKVRELEEEVQRLKRDLRKAETAAASAPAAGGADAGGGASSAAAEREVKKLEDEVKRLKRDLERSEAKSSGAAPAGGGGGGNGIPKEKLQKFHDAINGKSSELRSALRNLQNHMLTLKDVIDSHPAAKKALEDDDLIGQLEFELGTIEESAKATREGLTDIKTELDK